MPDALDLQPPNPNPVPSLTPPVSAQPSTPPDAPLDQAAQVEKQLPTVSELRAQMSGNVVQPGSPKQLPTVSELKQQMLSNQPKPASPWEDYYNNRNYTVDPFTGSVADTVFSQGPIGKILSAAGQSASDQWGSMKGVSSQELYKSMDPEDAKNDQAIVKSANEAWLRPLVYKIIAQEAANVANITENLVKPIFAAGAAFIGGVSQAGESLEQTVGKNPVSELARGAATGAGGDILPEAGHLVEAAREGTRPTGIPATPDLRVPIDPVTKFNTGRAQGVIGPDGERGFFGTTPVTPEEAQARAEAAQEAGMSPPEMKPNAMPTVQELARQVDPDTFKEWDRLTDLQENLRASLQYVLGREGEGESAVGLRERIQDTDYKLRDLIPETSEARNRVQEMLSSESPTGDQYRDYVQAQALEAALRMQELSRPVQEATDHARSLLPDETTPDTGEPRKPASDRPTASGTPTGDASGATGSDTGPGSRGSQPSSGVEGAMGGSNGLKGLSTGETKVAGGSNRLLQDAVLRGMGDPEDVEGLPEYVKFNAKEQMDRAAGIVANDKEHALDILDGKKAAPSDVHEQFILRALKSLADETQDADLARRIRKSPLNKQLSLAGQTLAARSGLYSADLTSLLENVENGKREMAGGFAKADAAIKATADSIKASVEESMQKFKGDVEAFAKSIQCDY